MAYIQQVGWDDFTIPSSIQIVSQGVCFLFNAGENTQRFRMEHGLSMGNLQNIFLTSIRPTTFDGMPGLLLALEASNIKNVSIYGPWPIKRLLAKMLKAFVYPTDMNISINEIDNAGLQELVHSFGITVYGCDYTFDNSTLPECIGMQGFGRRVAYWIKCDEFKGAFNPQDAMKLGVKPGPLYGKLKCGESVQLENGDIVHPNQVCGANIPGKQVLILDDNHRQDVNHAMDIAKEMQPPDYIIYIRSNFTNEDERRLVDACKAARIVHCDLSAYPGFYLPLPYADSLNSLHRRRMPKLFPKPIYGFVKVDPPPLTEFVIHPPNRIAVEICDASSTREYTSPTLVHSPKDLFPLFTADGELVPSLTFLGTGCSSPSVQRNVSAILLELCREYSVLLDCGEGTLMQLYHSSSGHPKVLVQRLKSIRVVFISHSHADHHMGLHSFLSLRNHCYRDAGALPVKVIAPKRVLQWLEFYKGYSVGFNYEPIELTSDLTFVDENALGKIKMTFFSVDHIEDSLGLRLQQHGLGTLVYSGDTRPCDSLVEGAKDCNVLIHEASFTDEDVELARLKKHSTISEALSIGKECNAEFIILTHFSQRYKKIEVPGHYDAMDNVIIAYDLMTIPLIDVPRNMLELTRAINEEMDQLTRRL